jgi:hypothetical protein
MITGRRVQIIGEPRVSDLGRNTRCATEDKMERDD